MTAPLLQNVVTWVNMLQWQEVIRSTVIIDAKGMAALFVCRSLKVFSRQLTSVNSTCALPNLCITRGKKWVNPYPPLDEVSVFHWGRFIRGVQGSFCHSTSHCCCSTVQCAKKSMAWWGGEGKWGHPCNWGVWGLSPKKILTFWTSNGAFSSKF